jgi:hypothetical protein
MDFRVQAGKADMKIKSLASANVSTPYGKDSVTEMVHRQADIHAIRVR